MSGCWFRSTRIEAIFCSFCFVAQLISSLHRAGFDQFAIYSFLRAPVSGQEARFFQFQCVHWNLHLTLPQMIHILVGQSPERIWSLFLLGEVLCSELWEPQRIMEVDFEVPLFQVKALEEAIGEKSTSIDQLCGRDNPGMKPIEMRFLQMLSSAFCSNERNQTSTEAALNLVGRLNL